MICLQSAEHWLILGVFSSSALGLSTAPILLQRGEKNGAGDDTLNLLHSATKFIPGLFGISGGKFAGEPCGFVLLRMLKIKNPLWQRGWQKTQRCSPKKHSARCNILS